MWTSAFQGFSEGPNLPEVLRNRDWCEEEERERNGALVPDGAPDWVTAELIADTLETWQPYYQITLTTEEALEIILSVGRFLDLAVLEQGDDQAVSGLGQSLIP